MDSKRRRLPGHKRLGNISTIEADDLKLEDAGSDCNSDSDSADGAE
jgi:hypothetical protein